MPATGVASSTHRARSPLVVKLMPRSLKERCGGPAVLRNAKSPVSSVETMLASGVRRDHGP